MCLLTDLGYRLHSHTSECCKSRSGNLEIRTRKPSFVTSRDLARPHYYLKRLVSLFWICPSKD